MKDLKILILLFYYNRPKIVRNALQSIVDSSYKNYQVVMIDDSPNGYDGWVTYCEYLPKINPKYVDKIFGYVHTKDTTEAKIARGGSNFGKFANQAMQESDADLCISLCDDDGFRSDYLANLNRFYNENPETMYAYTHLALFNPWEEDFNEVKTRTETSGYLNWQHPLNPFCQVDSSMVSHRLQEGNRDGITYPAPQTANLDSIIFSKMFNAWGNCVWTGFNGILKGWSLDTKVGQLGKRSCPYEGAE